MKKAISALMLMVGMSGCGLKVVKKQAVLDAITDAQTKVTAARNEACSQEYADKLDSTAVLLKALVNQFE